jgi:hypothetical protein
MNKLTKMLCTIVALCGLTTASNAGWLGSPYVEVGTSAVGVEAAGNHNDVQGAVTTGAVGKTAVTANYGVGTILGSGKFSLDLGYILTPGEAKLSTKSDSASAKDVSLEIDGLKEMHIAPMLNITDDARLYVKFGWVDADLAVKGDVNKINSMDGETLAVGTVMSWGSNMYIRTEAGMTEYDTLKFTGLGSAGGVSASETITATPDVHYGRISIGFKF